ncbi:hypothetical protein DMB66_43110 [Actinoplanes sp. ATCC 53533]|uniref:hypothetical protein n=1 Tax=Actinoplanes sp. ATCC 53533 TaxID=1288362 RepID=UPI0010018FA2|nr:hypothetical protein [Actinoplanes sp. ATCC 53533]RSM50582.1 hypothetical protein DMB66_43110 [Actinoplanes sp. ATCC 53533]
MIQPAAAAASQAAAAPGPAIPAPAPGLGDLAGLPVHGVSLEHPDTVAAEHWLASLSPAPVLACTHLVRSPRPHVALSLVFTDAAPELGAESPDAVAAHVARGSGRAVLYPGVELLVGTLRVADILALSAIEQVEVLGGGEADPAALIDTGGFVRPQWRAGVLTLTTTPAAGGRLVPFETRHPTPCCAAH